MRVGIDVGTTMTKVVLFGPTGEVVSRMSEPTALLHPAPGRYEHDVEQLFGSVTRLLREVPMKDVDLIALTGQGDGLWLLDEHARAVRPALSWMDARGAPVCETWSRSGTLDAVFARTGNAPFPGAGAALLVALEQVDPDALDAARTATQCQHALFERLTGVRSATRSCAMLPVLHPAVGDYDDEALRLTALERRRELLPPIAQSSCVTAPIAERTAHQLELSPKVVVATGPYDLPAAALGVGPRAVGDGVLILGTTLACEVLVENVRPRGLPVGLTLCTGDDTGWLRAMPAMVGTACIDWALDLVRADRADLRRMLASTSPGANGVSALPFFSPAGERAPFADAAARAEFTGLSLETTAADMVRAVCEALAYAARQCFQAAGISGDVVACGGGAGTPELVQLFADVLERPILVGGADEPAARGAVVASTIATGSERLSAPAHATVWPSASGRTAEGYAQYVERLGVARRHGWRRGAS